MNKEYLKKAGAIVIALLLWQVISMIVGMDMLFASPVKVIQRLFELIFEAGFLKTIWFSMLRIASGFLLAFVFGFLFAILAGRFSWVETLLWPYMTAIKSVPVASFIILCLIWFSYNTLTILISFLIAFPVIYSNVLQGFKSVDPNMLEVAKLYKVSRKQKLLYIDLPCIKPYLISAGSVAMGMAWKAGVAAEVIGVVGNSIGERLYNAKIYFQNADLLAWTVVIILLSVLGEKLFHCLIVTFFKRLEKR